MEYSHIKIIIVDDEPAIRESLEEFLKDYNFPVLSASTGEEALEMVAESSFDVAIVDMRLPGISGDVFILKAFEKYPDLRFLLHTGSSNYVISKELQHIGMRPEHLFRKPVVNLDKIIRAIEELMRQS